ncbi:uncharacterized protein LOC100841084 [Brachypodium distachyon]|uniref:uncharacterized protein LOC100841084 n=1 Tax=Brachypodium distachyon TaxID=15368 RepID=UPI000234EF60|nr:uncharacterized protein LOC100841084 [Brachypodium distachyon]|eukprot:XP_003579274.1 uncharacterized protein LOC100841084 [Brachypodium distachyon]
MSSPPKNKRPMEADPTSSREEEVQANKRNPRREEEPALLPMPAGSAGFFIHPKWLNAKIERDRLEAELGLTPPVEAQIPTLEDFEPPTTFHTERLLHVRESGSKAVLTAARSLLGVSSSVGGKPLKRCSGFWIDWDEESKTRTALTTAHLIRTKTSPTNNIWSGGEEYASHANVTVHLLDGTSTEGQLLYHQPHYDVAFVRVVQTMRRRYKYIPRPQLGMTFKAIKLLEPAHVDKIWRMCNIDDGLVVQEVSKGSHAEKFGIQIGDIIERCNGECVSTTVELENMLMSICKCSSDDLNGLNVEVNVSILSSKLPVVCRLGSLSISTQ